MAFDPQSYQAWRATVPFTNEQIGAAFDHVAEQAEKAGRPSSYLRWRADSVRKGYLKSRDLRDVLPLLITRCDICGAKALYRTGLEGRCSLHRLIRARSAAARVKRLEVEQAQVEARRRARDYQDLERKALKDLRRLKP